MNDIAQTEPVTETGLVSPSPRRQFARWTIAIGMTFGLLPFPIARLLIGSRLSHYSKSAIGLLVLVTHRHFSIFRVIRADYLLIAVLLGYVVLVIYEFWLLSKI